MNLYISLAIILVCLFFIISATTAYVEKDRTFNLAVSQTYHWVETRANDHDQVSAAEMDAVKRIQQSVRRELAKRGWKENQDHPDVLISYDVLVNKIREREEKSASSYTESFTRFYYNKYSAGWSAIHYPSQFVGYDAIPPSNSSALPSDKATLTITLLETQTNKKLWQGWATEKFPQKRLTEREIERSVNAIFRCGV